jgi:hypothetical protein
LQDNDIRRKAHRLPDRLGSPLGTERVTPDWSWRFRFGGRYLLARDIHAGDGKPQWLWCFRASAAIRLAEACAGGEQQSARGEGCERSAVPSAPHHAPRSTHPAPRMPAVVACKFA